ncbi:MAG TPA: hypothetical protein VLH61_02965, partial [Bacteroidales bacterium]|nr:hypothetical protein [Bacteroidales bacterium]
MKRFSVYLFSGLILFSLSLSGQRAWDFSKDSIIERLRKDVFVLSAAEMQGRESGTEGERLAAAYVKKRMQEIGLEPMFEGSFFQEVPFYGELTPGPNNHLTIGREPFTYGDDFYVLPQSGNTSISAKVVYAGFGLEGVEGHDDYQDIKRINGKIVMLEY